MTEPTDEYILEMDSADSEVAQSLLSIRLLNDDIHQSQREWCFGSSEVIRIGRGDQCEVSLNHRSVSRCHSVLIFKDGEWSCGTMGRNGTLLDGRLTSMFEITDGLVAQFAPKGPRLRFELLDPDNLGSQSQSSESEEDDLELSAWLQRVAVGDEDAAYSLFQEYFERIVRVARRKLGAGLRRVADEEDVAVSVFESLCSGIREGRYPDLSSRNNLWRLLMVMTSRKVVNHVERQTAQKRGGRMVRGESFFFDASDLSPGAGLEQFADEPLAPEVGMQMAEEMHRLMGLLRDDVRDVARMRLEGMTLEEIADDLGIATRTVQRRMTEIREVWSAALGRDVDV